MFTSRLTRAFGLALAVFFLSAGLTSLSDGARAQDKKDDKKKVKSKLKILVPQDDAELLIENMPTKPTGATREFETPALEVGKPYEYDFSVTWRPNNYTVLTRTKKVEFKGGEEVVTADLTKADPKAPDKAVIRWVPTPDDIVAEMIKLGGVKKDDVVYEPGPGDARVLIACVKAGAKKAVGIELDPKKAAEANENIKKAKLEEKITIIEGDAAEGSRLQRGHRGDAVHGQRVQRAAPADPGKATQAGHPHRLPPVHVRRLGAGQDHQGDRPGRRRVHPPPVDREGKEEVVVRAAQRRRPATTASGCGGPALFPNITGADRRRERRIAVPLSVSARINTS